jgi:hypothetical protein
MISAQLTTAAIQLAAPLLTELAANFRSDKVLAIVAPVFTGFVFLV